MDAIAATASVLNVIANNVSPEHARVINANVLNASVVNKVLAFFTFLE